MLYFIQLKCFIRNRKAQKPILTHHSPASDTNRQITWLRRANRLAFSLSEAAEWWVRNRWQFSPSSGELLECKGHGDPPFSPNPFKSLIMTISTLKLSLNDHVIFRFIFSAFKYLVRTTVELSLGFVSIWVSTLRITGTDLRLFNKWCVTSVYTP